MKKIISITLAILMAIVPLVSQALSFPAGLSDYLMPDGNIRFGVSLELESLLPYGKETLEGLNAILPHIAMNTEIGGTESCFSLCVDDRSAADFTSSYNEGQSLLTASVMKNRTFVSHGDALSAFFSSKEEDSSHSFDLYQAIDEAKAAAPALLTALEPYATSKKANYSIKNVGKGLWVHIARLTPEQSSELYEPLCNVLLSGLGDDYLATLNGFTFAKALTAAVYKTAEDGDIIAVYISGKIKHPNGKNYTLNYLFAYSDKAISYKLELGKGSKGGVGISALVKESVLAKEYKLNTTLTASFRASDGKTTWTEKETTKLEGKQNGNDSKLSGTINHSVETATDTKTTASQEYTPDLCVTGGEMTGSIGIKISRGKNTTSKVKLIFSGHTAEAAVSAVEEDSQSEEAGTVSIVVLDEEEDTAATREVGEYEVGAPPAGVRAYSAPAEPTAIDLDSLSDEELTELQSELFQNTAANMLKLIFEYVPQSDLLLFSDSVNAETFAELLQSVENVP